MFTAAQWTLVALANAYGLDKKEFADRIAFGKEIVREVEAIPNRTVADLGQLRTWIDSADEPDLFARALLAIHDILLGNPTGYAMGLDATQSGPQLLSCLGGCLIGMRNTNALDTPGNGVSDLYSIVADDELGLTRTQVKKATVPYVYGSVRGPEDLLGDAFPAFEVSYAKAVPMAALFRTYLLEAWNEKALHYTWVCPDGHISHNKVLADKEVTGHYKGVAYKFMTQENRAKKRNEPKTSSLVANPTHTWDGYVNRELTRRCNYDRKKLSDASNAIELVLLGHVQHSQPDPMLLFIEQTALKAECYSIAAIDYIQAGCLLDVSHKYLRELNQVICWTLYGDSFPVFSVHDQFTASPMHIGRVKQVYNRLLAESYKSSWLFDVVEQLAGVKLHHMKQYDSAVFDSICENTYALS